MEANVYSFEILIGTTDLRLCDVSMGCVCGDFSPTENYYKLVRSRIWQYFASKQSASFWQTLGLNVQLENGCFLHAAGGITITDLQELPNETIPIDIAGLDRHVIESFFEAERPELFVIEPWESISIEQKIAFENELSLELGHYQSNKWFLNFFNTDKYSHPLSGIKAHALCTFSGNDDVLFRIENSGCEDKFALVHLTWRGSSEVAGYPQYNLYSDFEEFKRIRMYPDNEELDN